MPQSYVSLQYHIVLSTKDRQPFLSPEIRPRLYAYLGGILRSEGGVLAVAGGVADHVHLLGSISKRQAISDALRVLKANSTGWIHATFPALAQFSWQSGYSAFSIGRTEIEAVTRYIRNQEEHHKSVTFKEELLDLLRRYGIEYDERYLWA
jgi:REP element-mobilizing transposase RayT